MNKNPKKRGRKPKDEAHYVENEEILEEIKKYYDTGVFSHRLGEIILRIVDGLAHRPNFMNYPCLDDMVGDAIYKISKTVLDGRNSDKGFKIIPEEDIGKIKKDSNGNTVYEVNPKTKEFVLDSNGNKTPKIIKQNKPFAYFGRIAWFCFLNRIKEYHKIQTGENAYKDKIYEDFEIEYGLCLEKEHDSDNSHDYHNE